MFEVHRVQRHLPVRLGGQQALRPHMPGDVAVAAVGPAVGGAAGDGEQVLGTPHDGERVLHARQLADLEGTQRGFDQHDHLARREIAYLPG